MNPDDPPLLDGTDASPTPMPLAARTEFGKYELLEEIGRGGMGVVFKARQKDLDRVVAIKVILTGTFASEQDVRRFQTEAKASAKLQHAHIVRVHEAGKFQGHHFLAMEFVEGQSLGGLVRKGALEPETAAKLVSTVTRAVAYLHAQGIVHRDLKPANILLNTHGDPFVTDFGLAKMFEPGSSVSVSAAVVGTPSYMSPEQAVGRDGGIGPLTDVYSLGVILYELLTGRPPFVADTMVDTIVQVLESEPKPPTLTNRSIPRELELICLRCLEKKSEDRYASATALADDLDRYLKGEPIEAKPRGLAIRMQHWARRQPALASRLGAILVCLIVAQINYHLVHSVALTLHLQIMGVLGALGIGSVVFQKLLNVEKWPTFVRSAWCASDVILFTTVLKLDEAQAGPLLVGYPLLIAASGLWFREGLVWFTTLFSVAAYGFLVVDSYQHHKAIPSPHWHILFAMVLIVLGFIVAYQVHRVRALSRYYERRPLP